MHQNFNRARCLYGASSIWLHHQQQERAAAFVKASTQHFIAIIRVARTNSRHQLNGTVCELRCRNRTK
jgi:hypothetical protein